MHVVGREILDSRGNPTVEVEVVLASGAHRAGGRPERRVDRRARGRRAARRRRSLRRQGRANAVGHVNGEIADELRGRRRASTSGSSTTALLDLDGTDNKARLGANAILGTSLAVAKAAADELELPLYRYVGGANAHVLPVPMMNVVNGGVHADNTIDLQEFMVMPVGAPSFSEALRWGAETYHVLKRVLHDRGLSTAVGDEGGFAPEPCRPTRTPSRFLVEAIDAAGLHAGRGRSPSPWTRRRASSTATAATTSTGEGKVLDARRDGRLLDAPRRHVPDRVDRGRHGRGRLGRLGGADRAPSATGCSSSATTCSSPTPAGLQQGIDRGVANAVLVKVNQIGTLTETLDTVELATRNGYASVMSHRSGETEDTTIADLAVATNCGQIKTGAPARSDRVAKYNQLLRLEAELGEAAAFRGGRPCAHRVRSPSAAASRQRRARLRLSMTAVGSV